MRLRSEVEDRALGCLWGLALGDALGMPTQSLSRETIQSQFGAITQLMPARPDQPIAPGMPAGSVTDDTEQALIVAQLLLDGDGSVEPRSFAHALISWEEDMVARGSRDLLGPSTKAAISALQSGASPEKAGRNGTTNGAAMRVAPVGIAHPPGARLIDAVVSASQVTHHTGLGISAASAIAAAVSTGIAGQGIEPALQSAVDAAEDGAARGHWIAGASIPRRFASLRTHAQGLGATEFTDFLYDVVGTSVQSQESVVSALLVVDRFQTAPFEGLCCTASLGGDTDTIGAMAGAVLGAAHGMSAFPEHAIETVATVNDLPLPHLAHLLLDLRSANSKES